MDAFSSSPASPASPASPSSPLLSAAVLAALLSPAMAREIPAVLRRFRASLPLHLHSRGLRRPSLFARDASRLGRFAALYLTLADLALRSAPDPARRTHLSSEPYLDLARNLPTPPAECLEAWVDALRRLVEAADAAPVAPVAPAPAPAPRPTRPFDLQAALDRLAATDASIDRLTPRPAPLPGLLAADWPAPGDFAPASPPAPGAPAPAAPPASAAPPAAPAQPTRSRRRAAALPVLPFLGGFPSYMKRLIADCALRLAAPPDASGDRPGLPLLAGWIFEGVFNAAFNFQWHMKKVLTHPARGPGLRLMRFAPS